MKIYVSCQERWAACYVVSRLSEAGHYIVSSWHGNDYMDTMSHRLKTEAASRSLAQIDKAEVLVLVSVPGPHPGGKFIEAGYAKGQKKPVIILGRPENILAYHPDMHKVDCIEELLTELEYQRK